MPHTRNLLAVLALAVGIGAEISSSSAHAQSPPSMIFTGEARHDWFGWSVSEAGDIDKDGYAELIVGAPENNKGGLGTGRAYVFSGQTGALLYTFIGEATGAFTGEALGYSVSGAADVDNDGYADLVVGAPNGGLAGSAAGRVYVHSGKSGARLRTFNGETLNDFFGRSVSGAGDVDNDGYADLIIGAVGNDVGGDGAGRAYVYSGQSGSLLYTFTGEAAGDAMGYSVSGAGDVNNDGFADLIVGAAFNDLGGDYAGRAYVYCGQSGALLFTFTGEAARDQFGWSVSGAGNVDDDSYADVIIGARLNDAGGNAAGRAYVYSGQTGALLHTFTGEGAGDSFGFSVSGVGDVNKDGYADLFVGATSPSRIGFNTGDPGRAYVYSGRTGSLLYLFRGEKSWDQFGWSVSGAADINNDGSADMVVGAIWNDAGGELAGRAYVYSLDSCCTTPGDANGDEKVNIADVDFIISWLFSGGLSPSCFAESSANGDDKLNIADVTFLIARIFAGGTAPICGTTGA